tara:strand:+ start:633 stop:1727 length:1095 start_codon:yes stop_codon:yes gene_type:complete
MTKKNILIASGGTGGHVFPAYSLANFLSNQSYNVKLITDKRGYEYLKNHKNLNLIKMPSSPLLKKNIFKLIYSILTIIFSIVISLLFLLFNRPSIIFGMGGYSSFPICIAATILRIKFVIYENNLIIGKANKYLIPFTEKILVSYEDLEGIPKKYNYKVTKIGNIVRKEIINSRIENLKSNKFDDINLLILGGSQAAKIFGEILPSIIEKVSNSNIPIKVYQQCQKEQSEKLSKFYTKAKIRHEVFNFSEKIIDYYLKANLVITRSGASVLGELVNLKIPFISIPLPTSADNHQQKNAEFYLKRGYGYLVEEKDIKDKLYSLIRSFFEDKTLIKNIITNQKQYSDKNIFKNLDDLIKEILDEKN